MEQLNTVVNWWRGNLDVPNPISGLSLRDITLIQKSWAPVYADAINNGLLMFFMLFRKDPESQNLFVKIQNLNEEEIAASPRFKAHVINLMGALNVAIINLKEPDVVIEFMKNLGDKHRSKHVKKKHFKEFENILVEVFTKILKLDDRTMAAWGRFISFIYEPLLERLED